MREQINSEWSKKCFVILQNEIEPRAKKLGLKLQDFLDPRITSILAKLEFDGVYTRRDVRALLDERVKYLNGVNDMTSKHE